jgi:hypothetical protein
MDWPKSNANAQIVNLFVHPLNLKQSKEKEKIPSTLHENSLRYRYRARYRFEPPLSENVTGSLTKTAARLSGRYRYRTENSYSWTILCAVTLRFSFICKEASDSSLELPQLLQSSQLPLVSQPDLELQLDLLFDLELQLDLDLLDPDELQPDLLLHELPESLLWLLSLEHFDIAISLPPVASAFAERQKPANKPSIANFDTSFFIFSTP